ncbi:MAG TPA: hypothetical protein VGL59_22805 [Polyangia bacterium]
MLGSGLGLSSVARATTYDESVSGDLSGNRLAPTAIPLTVGSNRITATSSAGDVEYFHLTVPPGTRMSAIVVVSNTGASLSFIAVQRGGTFTEPPTGTNVAQLLGYSHFGVGNGTIGTDILDNIGTGAGAIGFLPPLTPGDYTFWSQETSGVPSTYTLDFQVTTVATAAPMPRYSLWLMAFMLAAIGIRMVRRYTR